MSIWFKCDARFHKDPKILALPTDTARYAFLMLIGEAKYLRSGGVFESLNHLHACIPEAYHSSIDALLKSGLLARRGKKIRIKAWESWQVDPTSAERSRRSRAATAQQRPSNGTATVPQRGREREEREKREIIFSERRNTSNGQIESIATIVKRGMK